jgi:hypothetical protein
MSTEKKLSETPSYEKLSRKLFVEEAKSLETKSFSDDNAPTPISTKYILPSAPIKNTIPPVFSPDYTGRKLLFDEENKEDDKR